MTFVEAAIKILKENNIPMTSEEIWDKIFEQNLIKSIGKTPSATLKTAMSCSSVNSNLTRQNKVKYFEIVENNPIKYILLNNNQEIIIEEEPIKEEKILLYQITSQELEWKLLSVYNNQENIEYEISDCNEYTYIMEDNGYSIIKIGKTKNDPILRWNQLKTANPTIKLLHVFPSIYLSESDLHKKFNDYKKDLEWFFYTKHIQNFLIDEMNKHNKTLISYSKRKELDMLEDNMIKQLYK